MTRPPRPAGALAGPRPTDENSHTPKAGAAVARSAADRTPGRTPPRPRPGAAAAREPGTAPPGCAAGQRCRIRPGRADRRRQHDGHAHEPGRAQRWRYREQPPQPSPPSRTPTRSTGPGSGSPILVSTTSQVPLGALVRLARKHGTAPRSQAEVFDGPSPDIPERPRGIRRDKLPVHHRATRWRDRHGSCQRLPQLDPRPVAAYSGCRPDEEPSGPGTGHAVKHGGLRAARSSGDSRPGRSERSMLDRQQDHLLAERTRRPGRRGRCPWRTAGPERPSATPPLWSRRGGRRRAAGSAMPQMNTATWLGPRVAACMPATGEERVLQRLVDGVRGGAPRQRLGRATSRRAGHRGR